MRVFLKEFTEEGGKLLFDHKSPWVITACEEVDEKTEVIEGKKENQRVSQKNSKKPAPRTVKLDLTLRKMEGFYWVKGKLTTQLQLLCSRCAKIFTHPIDQEFSQYFTRDKMLRGVESLGKGEDFSRGRAESSETLPPEQDLDVTFLTENFIDLNEVLLEQLRLAVPFQPLCRSECKGVCQVCGTDLNLYRCACEKLARRNPFSVLSDLDIKN